MDEVGLKLSRLYPDQYGLLPTNHEIYIALAVRDYLMVLEQNERKKVLRNLVVPRVVRMDGEILSSDVNREYLGMLAEFATHETLKALGKMMAEDTVKPGVDVETAVGIKALAIGAVQKSYEAFRADRMSEELERFLHAVYAAVRS